MGRAEGLGYHNMDIHNACTYDGAPHLRCELSFKGMWKRYMYLVQNELPYHVYYHASVLH